MRKILICITYLNKSGTPDLYWWTITITNYFILYSLVYQFTVLGLHNEKTFKHWNDYINYIKWWIIIFKNQLDKYLLNCIHNLNKFTLVCISLIALYAFHIHTKPKLIFKLSPFIFFIELGIVNSKYQQFHLCLTQLQRSSLKCRYVQI